MVFNECVKVLWLVILGFLSEVFVVFVAEVVEPEVAFCWFGAVCVVTRVSVWVWFGHRWSVVTGSVRCFGLRRAYGFVSCWLGRWLL